METPLKTCIHFSKLSFLKKLLCIVLFVCRLLLARGKSRPWEEIIEEMFNITELNTEPLLNYFKPLEKFFDEGAKFQNSSSTGFSEKDFKLFLTSSSASDKDKKGVF